MIGCLRTHVRKQPIFGLYFEPENELKFYNLETKSTGMGVTSICDAYLGGASLLSEKI